MPHKQGSQGRVRALGAAIRATRVEKGYSQESFAKHAGFDRSFYGAIERGRFNVTYGTLLRVSAGFGVPVSTLVERAEPEPLPESPIVPIVRRIMAFCNCAV
jgi:transcriptional regulator with XRE-family HTH domain